MDLAALAPTNPAYKIIKDAAQLLKEELSFMGCGYDEPLPKNNNNNNKDEENRALELEMLFLRSTVEYFYKTGLFPFASPEDAFEFASTYLKISVGQYIQENQRYKRKFKNRVLQICIKLEPLETTREQDAFELGIRIWGSLSVKLVQRRLELEQEENAEYLGDLTSSTSSSSLDEIDDNDDDDGKLMNGVLEKYPALKRAIRVSGRGAEMPEVLKEVVEKGGKKLGEERVNEMDEQWKAVQMEEMERFLAKIVAMKIQASYLLDELQGAP